MQATAPETASDFIWWAFQLAFLGIVWFMKRDLGEIKSDGKANRILTESNSSNIQTQKAVCEERHRRIDLEIAEMKKHTP